jgi:GTP-binding protein
MYEPVVAIVGRPNVGKSTLFNKLVGRRVSIVEDTPGVTRDRISAECEWSGRRFMLVDTGGIETGDADSMFPHMLRQAKAAIDAADAVVMVTDLRTGVTAQDAEVADMLRRSGKPVVVCVNKADSPGPTPSEAYEFYNLGLGDPYPVSSLHGHGTGDLLDRIIELLPEDRSEPDEGDAVKVAVIGRPNVGKSSLINRIAGEERVIVSDIPGTTRDAVDTLITNEKGKFIFIDTAGIRRKSKVDEDIEKYSVMRSYSAVDRADVCVMMIDAGQGFAEQDSKIAGYACEAGKGVVVAVNKWDVVDKNERTMDAFRKKLADDLSFMPYAQTIFISAKTGLRVDGLFDLIKQADASNSARISTGLLNDMLADAVARVQPPSDKGRRLKLLYMTQPSTNPPAFVIFVNKAELFHFSYQRYIENRLRTTFGLEGTPIRLIVRERSDSGTQA